MNELELYQQLHNHNDTELFYKRYQACRKDKEKFKEFINSLDIDEAVQMHLLVPEIKETMPPSMKDEYFIHENDAGMVIQKHNCYSPEFKHSHTFFEAFYVFEGICQHEINGQRKTLRMGDFCIIPPGVPHSIYVDEHNIVIVMILSTETIENVFKNPTYYKNNKLSDFFLKNLRYSDTNSYLMFHTGNDQELKDTIIQMILESTNKYQEFDAILNAYFSIFFAKLIRYYENTIEISSGSAINFEAAYEITNYIQNHHNTVTLEQIAKRYSYSIEYMSSYIKKITGKTFTEILIESRMKQAVSLLKSTNITVAEIAFQVGYENVENFIRTFKKKYNQTPTAYRKQQSINYI